MSKAVYMVAVAAIIWAMAWCTAHRNDIEFEQWKIEHQEKP